MTTKASIVAAISAKVGTAFTAWRIGITHDVAERKEQWKASGEDVRHWTYWQANSLSDAQEIEANFISKKMKGGTGGDMSARRTTCVYIF